MFLPCVARFLAIRHSLSIGNSRSAFCAVRLLHYSAVSNADGPTRGSTEPIRASTERGGTTGSTKLKQTKYGAEVYVGSLHRMVRNVKMFSLSTSLVSLCAQPYVITRAAELPAFVNAVLLGGFLFIFMTPILLHLLTRQYVLALYYNARSDRYTALVYTIFLRLKAIQFAANETQPPTSRFSAMANCEVRGTPMFFYQPDFIDLRVYEKMMRYDLANESMSTTQQRSSAASATQQRSAMASATQQGSATPSKIGDQQTGGKLPRKP
jgi:hypothetical protein